MSGACGTNVPCTITVAGKLLRDKRKKVKSADQGKDGGNNSNSVGPDFLRNQCCRKRIRKQASEHYGECLELCCYFSF